MSTSLGDCVIALSFGKASEKTAEDMNKTIAERAMSFGLPVLAQEEVAAYIPKPFYVIKAGDGYIDTWSVLEAAQAQMKSNDFKGAILVAHKAHSKRAARQAAKQHINFTLPDSLPTTWDAYSEQWWTRSRLLWSANQIIQVPKLKLIHRL